MLATNFFRRKKYKRKEYTAKKSLMEFPVKANSKIEPHKGKSFDEIDITEEETERQEILNIQLVRNKTTEETSRQKPD